MFFFMKKYDFIPVNSVMMGRGTSPFLLVEKYKHLLTWDHSMATHWGQAKVLQICRATGRGEWLHFHSSTWENCPRVSSSTHNTLRSCQPPPSPQDTEHWVQGPCSQLQHTEQDQISLQHRCNVHDVTPPGSIFLKVTHHDYFRQERQHSKRIQKVFKWDILT